MRAFVAAAITVATVVIPWLVWTPFASTPTAVITCGAAAIACACHGFGRVVAWICGYREVGAALAVQWGIAVMIALGGVLLAAGAYDARLLLVAGTVAHTAHTLIGFDICRGAVAESFQSNRLVYWILPAVLLGVLGVVHVLGGAGAIGDRPFDDDTNVVAQIARLTQTGELADPIGYPRFLQLGGRMAIDGLVGAFGEPRAVRIIEGLALVLVLWLAVARLRPRDGVSAIWSCLAIVTGAALVIKWPDLLPLWLPAGLLVTAVLALHDAPRDTRSQIPLVLVAASLAVLRLELLPVALVLLVAAWWPARWQLRDDLPRLACLAGLFGVVIGAYWIARSNTWSEVDLVARSLVEPRRGSAVVRFFMSVAIGLALLPALLIIIPRTGDDASVRMLRWLAIATAAGIGGIAGKITAERLFGIRSLWILAIAAGIVLSIELARRRELDRRAFALVTVLCLLIWEGRSAPGRASWSRRYHALLQDVEYARHASPQGGDYAQILATVPAGERVAVWVTRPELLDYRRHELIDLRTPRVVRLRSPTGNDPRLARLLRASRARWLLFETDEAYAGSRPRTKLHELLCPPDSRAPACTDALERIVQEHTVVAEHQGVALIRLAP